MSKLPSVQERPIPQAAPYNPQQIIVADTSAIPRAMGQLGQSLNQVGETVIRIDEQKNRFEYSLAKSKFLQAATEIQRNVESDPDFEKMPQRYKEEISRAKQDILSRSNLRSDFKELLANEMSIYEQKNYDNVLNTYAKKQYDYKIAETGRAVEGNFEAASRMTSEQDKEIALANSKNLFINAIPLNDPQREEKIGKIEVELEQRMAKLDLMQKNPYQQIQMIDAENKKPNSNLTKYLTPEQRIQFRERAQDDIKRLEKEREVEIKSGQKNNLYSNIVELALNDKILIDPTLKENKEAVDIFWSKKQSELIESGATEEQILNSSLNLVQKTGIVPTPIISAMNANILNGNPQQRAAFSSYLANAATVNPKVLNGMNKDTVGLAFSINENLKAGLSTEQSVEWALNNTNEAKKQSNKLRESEWQNLAKNSDLQKNIKEKFSENPSFNPFARDIEVPSQMINDFNILSKGYFVNNKTSFEAANNMAEKQLKSQWGITEIGGKKYMKYAPEVIYGNENNWVYKQLENEFKDNKDNLNLEVDYSTINTPKPSYFVFKEDEYGGVNVVLDEFNRPKKFIPNYEDAESKKMLEAAAKLNIEIQEAAKERDYYLKQQNLRELLPLGR